ncbi:MAG: amino acid permease [Theionarchaea archaeon]|nr:amino acid permease [Theionarchaea archaeon]MBU7001398.1 amino acid permease [Theionarchaea archaeon]MBU7021759.1 amino acid permease [Theionarchaea archaeon]MBU7034499.1 amino acid permease [Theionarchaea archaeon]MBU7040804.1 amino acid permease [Theionarchaea archaeon]
MKPPNTSSQEKLTLRDAVGMAIGGMVGGGIFAVLGEAVHQSGNAAFISFGLAGILAFVTGISYSRLTLSFNQAGGSFLFVEKIAGPRVSGTLGWFLLLGYIFTMSLYSYTFGAYAGTLLGLDPAFNGYLGGGIVAFFAVINLLGVRESGLSEDILVYAKLSILIVVAAVGFLTVRQEEAFPILEYSMSRVVTAAALVFVAYEGFQLLTYDFEDIDHPRRNLPRAIWISIPVVTAVYMTIAFVTTGSLTNQDIAGKKEIVLAYVAQPLLGRTGVVMVLVAAVFSTASAINATLFSVSRLADRISRIRQLPPRLTERQVGGVPVWFLILASGCAIVIQFVGDLHEIVGFSSLVFLSVFSVVNLSAYIHREYSGWMRVLPLSGTAGCIAAVCMLAYDLYAEDPVTLGVIAGIVAVLVVMRSIYCHWHPSFVKEYGK